MKNMLTLGLLALLILITSFSVTIYQLESQKRALKADLVELSKVKYGLFNVDEWKTILADILTKKIEEFNLDDTNKEQMEQKISDLLNQVLDQFEGDYKGKNRKKALFGISFKNAIANAASIFPRIRQQIPDITESIINFLDDPKNRERIRQYLLKKMNEYADHTFAETDYSKHNLILSKYETNDRAIVINKLKTEIQQLHSKVYPFTITLFSFITLLACLLGFAKGLTVNQVLISTIASLLLLLSGLLLPMIDIDARISEMNFQLLGESISFTDQVLYFKSKSILEIVYLMLSQSKLDVLAVGVLVFMFSVLFPVVKIICSVIYGYSSKLSASKFIQFMVFKTGKWSMADVMVIAIFMAYIGFSGIITEQLKQIEHITKQIEILTTNHSELQTGFFLFTSFVILSLLISQQLQNKQTPN